jgi:hypothetical protein
VCHGESLYLFGGYAFGGGSSFATLYPAFPINTSNYPSLASKYYLDDVWRYSIRNNTWAKARAAHRARAALRCCALLTC